MKLVRFEHNGTIGYGILEGDRIERLARSYFSGIEKTGETLAAGDVRLLTPCAPTKIVGCAGTYDRPGKPANPEKPFMLFLKGPSTLLNPGEDIVYPPETGRLIFENELTIVMGRRASHIRAEDAASYILGYTCGNDVTAFDLLPPQSDWTVAKGFDTFMPFGPCIETGLDPSALAIRTTVGGELRQQGNTSMIRYSVGEIVRYISGIMTLEPEDIILTGTPTAINNTLQPGDEIVMTLEGVGTLTNRVIRR